jgi:hypothetical protein
MAVRLAITVPAGYTIIAGKAGLRAVLRAAGVEVGARARALIRGGGKNRVSVPGEPPVSRTGTLASSIKVRPSKDGESVSIRDAAYYALFLEAGARGGVGSGKKGVRGKRNKRRGVVGTRVLLPRPFLSTALDQVANAGLAERVQTAVVEGLKFQRGKY